MARTKDERLLTNSETEVAENEDGHRLRWMIVLREVYERQRRKKSGEKRPTTGSNGKNN